MVKSTQGFFAPDYRPEIGDDTISFPASDMEAGDVVWIAEDFKSLAYGRDWGIEIHYRADSLAWGSFDREGKRRILDRVPDKDDRWRFNDHGRLYDRNYWHQAKEMPRWMSRYYLKATDKTYHRMGKDWRVMTVCAAEEDIDVSDL